jgi:hypothetical protein
MVERQISETFELHDIASDISGKLRLKFALPISRLNASRAPKRIVLECAKGRLRLIKGRKSRLRSIKEGGP